MNNARYDAFNALTVRPLRVDADTLTFWMLDTTALLGTLQNIETEWKRYEDAVRAANDYNGAVASIGEEILALESDLRGW